MYDGIIIAGLPTVVLTELYIASLGSISTVNMVRTFGNKNWLPRHGEEVDYLYIRPLPWRMIIVL